MHIEADFFSKVITKYLLEFLLTLTSLRILSYIIRSKLFISFLYIYHKLKLPFFLELNSSVQNHVFFNALYQLKLKLFLKYILNQKYREDISAVTDNLHERILSNVNENIISVMLFSRRKAFINGLIKNIQNIRIEHGDFIRTSAMNEVISNKFAWDYLLYMDFVLQFLLSRIKDLQNDSENNYQLYIKYLFIMNDFLTIFMEQIPGISRARLKGTNLTAKRV